MSEEMDKYRDDYIHEAKEHVNGLNQALLTLEKSPTDMQSINDFFRHAHTLKSMSAAMKFYQTEQLFHTLESVFDKIRQGQLDASQCITLFFQACDLMAQTILSLENNQPELKTDELTQQLQALLQLQKSTPIKLSNEDNSAAIQPIDKVRVINVKVERLDRLMNLSEEFFINKMKIDTIQKKLHNSELSLSVSHLSRLINELQFLVMQTRLVPLEYIFNRFPRMVRDLALQENKKVDMQMRGTSIELDRAIIDELGECLVHLLKNAIDHGIESREERARLKKFEMATITVNAERQRNSVLIKISDDGAGLQLKKIRDKAEKLNLILPNATEQQVIQTIFLNLTTSDKVTNVSGRGFGLNIVKRKIESLGGHVTVETFPGKGTNFILEVPLTLAVIRVLFVTSGDTLYAIPIGCILRLATIPTSKIKKVMHYEAIILDKEEIPITRLNQLFNNPEKNLESVPIVIVKNKDRMLGIVVDQLGAMENVVVKPMNTAVRKNRFFSGSTIMGTGQVALILDVMNMGVIN